MNTLKIIVLVLDLISAVLLTAIILFQSGKSAGLSSAIAGASDSFMSKGGSKTLDAKLAQLTKWVGLAFVILSLFAVILVSATKNQSANTETPETTAAVVTTEAAAGTTEAAVVTTEAAVETTAAAG